MTLPMQLQHAAQHALDAMLAAGFEQAQVTATGHTLNELNANENSPSMMRTGQTLKLSLLGLVDQRMASTELPAGSAEAVQRRVAALLDDARSAPRDEANAVSAGQRVRLVQGPQQCDPGQLAGAMEGLLAFRANEAPRMLLRSAEATHSLHQWHTLTSGGSNLAGSVGCYGLSAFGTAREGGRSSSFNMAGGQAHELLAQPADRLFGIGDMMRETERQIEARPFGDKFTGDVVLTPRAVESLLAWLLGQVGDTQLVAGTSLYRDSVGQAIASPLLSVEGRFDLPGVAAVSADAFATAPMALVRDGVLQCLTPTLYGSRKTGLAHVPVAGGGWEFAAGRTPRAEVIGGVRRGALVGRLSMGMPAANGNFSGVIKNSFAIDGGEIGHALSEVMISGNMAQMLRDVVAVSSERLDGGGTRMPWVRITNLHFS